MEGSIVESKNNKKQFKLVSNGDSFALQPLAARVTDTAYVFEGEVSEAFRAGLLTLKNTDRLSIARAIGIA